MRGRHLDKELAKVKYCPVFTVEVGILRTSLSELTSPLNTQRPAGNGTESIFIIFLRTSLTRISSSQFSQYHLLEMS